MNDSKDVRELLASEFMTTDVVTVSEDVTVKDLAELLSKHGISGAPVVDNDNRVVGIVTEGDMVEMDADIHFPHYIQFLDSVIFVESTKKFDERVRHMAASTVKDIMTSDVVTVQHDEPLHKIATLMADRNINRLPVVDGDTLVGIITRADLVRAMARG